MALVVRRQESRQYTGTAGQELAGWITNAEFLSEANGVLTLRVDQGAGAVYEPQLRAADWIVRASDGAFDAVYTPEQYAAAFVELRTA